MTTGLRDTILPQAISKKYLQSGTVKFDSTATSVDDVWVEFWLFKFWLERVYMRFFHK